jgi:hypothetical protein
MVVDPAESDEPFEHVVAAMDVVHLSPEGKKEMFAKDHKFGIDSNTGTNLAPDALDDDDWNTSRELMNSLERDGGLVYLPLNNTPYEGSLIGQVDPGTGTKPQEYEASSETSRETVTMKTMQLTGVRQHVSGDGHDLSQRVNTGRFTVHHLDEHGDKILEAYRDLY